jgi:nitrogen fixation protein NifX
MSRNAISRDLALRIGLAARAMPGTDIKRLLIALTAFAGQPIDEEKIAALTIADMKTLCDGELSGFDDGVLQRGLAALKGVPAEPETEAYADGDMPGSVRIACASDDGIHIDGHFGSCTRFIIYQVNADESRLIDLRDTAMPDGLEVEDKNVFRAGLIKDCQLLYVASVGGPAAAKIVKLGIHPIKLAGRDGIPTVISKLQAVLAETPPPWLAKAMGVQATDRIRFERRASE